MDRPVFLFGIDGLNHETLGFQRLRFFHSPVLSENFTSRQGLFYLNIMFAEKRFWEYLSHLPKTDIINQSINIPNNLRRWKTQLM